jgi:hypothetical protein
MPAMRAALVIALGLAACGKSGGGSAGSASAAGAGVGSGSGVAPGSGAGVAPGSGAAAGSARGAAPDAGATGAPALPEGIRALVPSAPFPAETGTDEVVLLSAQPGAPVTLTNASGQKLAIPDGAIVKLTPQYELVGGWTADDADRAERVYDILAERAHPHTAQVVLRAEISGADFPHHEVWFVPTIATRVRLAEDASTILVDWSDPQRRSAVVMLDEKGSLVDLATGAATPIAEHFGSPSFAADGTLYYRTLDGGAWRWSASGATKLGKGRRGKRQTGNLNDGIEPARYPPPITFDATGKPRFK